jgi:hypothetical protein
MCHVAENTNLYQCMYLIYHKFVLVLEGTMCKPGKLSVGDFPLKDHKNYFNLFKYKPH